MRKSLRQITSESLRFVDRRKAVLMIILLLTNAMLEFFSLAAFVPIMVMVVNPDIVRTNDHIHALYTFFDFNSHQSFVIAITLAVLLFLISKNFAGIWIARVKAEYAFATGRELSSRALLGYLRMDYLQFTRIDFSLALNRVTNYPFAFANNILLPLANLFVEGLLGLLVLGCVAAYDFTIFLLLLVILLPAGILYKVRRKKLEIINADLKTKHPRLVKYTLQLIEGFSEVMAFGKQLFFYNRFKGTNEDLTRAFVTDQMLQAVTIRSTEIIVGVVICVLVIYSMATNQPYHQTILLLGLYVAASFRLVPSINKILQSLQQIRIQDYLLQELEVVEHPTPKASQGEVQVPFESIQFQEVSFKYLDGATTLQKGSLTINRGDKVAIVGKSGEGKSTILLLLLRFLKETNGKFLVDGKSITDEYAWRSLIGYVPQNPYILDGTITENIAFGVPPEEVDFKRIHELIQHLELHELVSKSREGIEATIGERGVKLSGGQRQRIAIARALYVNPEILILDEATNQVHQALESDIWNLLDRLAVQGRTIIVVTHKLPSLNFFNAIYMLDGGQLHEMSSQVDKQ